MKLTGLNITLPCTLFIYCIVGYFPSNLPSNNTEWLNETDILLETLPKSDILLLDRRATDDLGDDEHQEDQGITVANASNISCHSTCSRNITDNIS